MTSRTNKDFPTLEKIDLVKGLMKLDEIDKNPQAMGFTDFRKGVIFAATGFYRAAIRSGSHLPDYFMPRVYRELGSGIDSSCNNPSYKVYIVDKRVASLRDCINDRYANNPAFDEVNRGAFAAYRVTRLLFLEEFFYPEDIDRLSSDPSMAELFQRFESS